LVLILGILKALRYVVASAIGIVFVACLFVVGPAYAIELGQNWGWMSHQHAAGLIAGGFLIVSGAVVFAYCTGLFAFRGRGTPVPVAPPSRFVATGLYSYSRNPIYVAYLIILLGEALVLGNVAMLVYAAAIFLLLHMLVVAHEEPELRRRFGAEYGRYQDAVPRWLPSRPPVHFTI
jgi:protein-S-isoprenylcysteine O-methyltransferase Ste14